MYEPLSRTQWQEHQHSTFAIQFQDGPVLTLTLDEVEDVGSNAQQEQYALRFTSTHYLAQQTYILNHPVLGPKAIFLVPVAREGERYRLEAIFNLIPS